MLLFKPPTPGTILAAVGLLLIILVCVSVPITKGIFFFSVTAAQDTFTFGIWGYCSNKGCSAPKLGYTFDPSVISANLETGLNKTLSTGLSYLLILHVPAAVLALITVIIGLFAHRREADRRHGLYRTSMTFSFVTTAVLIACIVIDIVLFTQASNKITSINSNLTTNLSNAIWMTVASAALFLIAGFLFLIGRSLALSRDRTRAQVAHHKEMSGEDYNIRMREEAIAAEEMRKARNGGLPSHPTYDVVELHDREATGFEDNSRQPSRIDTNLESIDGVGVGERRTPVSGMSGPSSATSPTSYRNQPRTSTNQYSPIVDDATSHSQAPSTYAYEHDGHVYAADEEQEQDEYENSQPLTQEYQSSHPLTQSFAQVPPQAVQHTIGQQLRQGAYQQPTSAPYQQPQQSAYLQQLQDPSYAQNRGQGRGQDQGQGHYQGYSDYAPSHAQQSSYQGHAQQPSYQGHAGQSSTGVPAGIPGRWPSDGVPNTHYPPQLPPKPHDNESIYSSAPTYQTSDPHMQSRPPSQQFVGGFAQPGQRR